MKEKKNLSSKVIEIYLMTYSGIVLKLIKINRNSTMIAFGNRFSLFILLYIVY